MGKLPYRLTRRSTLFGRTISARKSTPLSMVFFGSRLVDLCLLGSDCSSTNLCLDLLCRPSSSTTGDPRALKHHLGLSYVLQGGVQDRRGSPDKMSSSRKTYDEVSVSTVVEGPLAGETEPSNTYVYRRTLPKVCQHDLKKFSLITPGGTGRRTPSSTLILSNYFTYFTF